MLKVRLSGIPGKPLASSKCAATGEREVLFFDQAILEGSSQKCPKVITASPWKRCLNLRTTFPQAVGSFHNHLSQQAST